MNTTFEMINRQYLFNIGMSGARVKGEIVKALDPIKTDWDISSGTLGVKLDEGTDYFIVAIATGLGFVPFKSSKHIWEQTGRPFDGSLYELKMMSDDSQDKIDLSSYAEILRNTPEVTQVFVGQQQVSATLFDPPVGPQGYESQYRIILNNNLPSLITVILVFEGKTRTLNTDTEEAASVINSALDIMRSLKGTRKQAFTDIEELKSQVPASYDQLNGVKWIMFGDQLLTGPSHYDIMKEHLVGQLGNAAFDYLVYNYRGTFDFENQVIGITLEVSDPSSPRFNPNRRAKQPPPVLVERLKNEYRRISGREPVGIVSFVGGPKVLAGRVHYDTICRIGAEMEIYLSKFANKMDMEQGEVFIKDHSATIADTDRYATDRYDIYISLRGHKYGYSLGLQAVHAQIGTASYNRYWDYGTDEKTLAICTFQALKTVVEDVKNTIEYQRLPTPSVMSLFRNKVAEIDQYHQENIVDGHSRSLLETYEPDWRVSLYGNRYPSAENTMEVLGFNWNVDDPSKAPKTIGSGRNRKFTYQYDMQEKTAGKARSIPLWMALMGLTAYDAMNSQTPSAPIAPVQAPAEIEQNEPVISPESAEPEIENPNNEQEIPETTQPQEQPTQEQHEQEQLPRGIRNNNPGNIELSNVNWQGARDQQNDQRFVQFEYPQDGIRAMARVLRNYQRRHNLNTIENIITRWAPGTENNTRAYIDSVGRHSGLRTDQEINLDDDETLMRLMQAMIRHENGQNPYGHDVLMQAIQAERNTERPWAQEHDMPIKPNSKKLRETDVSNSLPPFYSPQQELSIFNKDATLTHLNLSDITRRVKEWTRGGLRWPDIVKRLKVEGIPQEMIGKLWRIHVVETSYLASRWQFAFEKQS